MNDDTLLHRQVHPRFVDSQGITTSQAFRPTLKDSNRLSVYDGSLITAEDAWKHYTDELKLRSIGVLSVTVAQCRGLELPVDSDAETFSEHALIDFRGLSRKQIERKANALKAAANARDWQFRPRDTL